MKQVPRIMNMTNGDEVNLPFETIEECEEWIYEQDNPGIYEIMETTDDY